MVKNIRNDIWIYVYVYKLIGKKGLRYIKWLESSVNLIL